MLNGFDKIAKVYDLLAKMIFGNSIKKAQTHFINRIPEKATVLILGGGTGWILREILKQHTDCKFVYIEASKKMLSYSRAKIVAGSDVQFVHGTEQEIPAMEFDVVITNFYLDLFPNEKLREIIIKVKSSLRYEGSWIVTDFVDENKWWQKFLLKLMYKFFIITCKIEAQHLPDYVGSLRETDLHAIDSRKFFGGFIKTQIFRF
jgi:ubiquinone/menaquinone biosynthesis C-methylase UbiE